jgi:hypothetical protein
LTTQLLVLRGKKKKKKIRGCSLKVFLPREKLRPPPLPPAWMRACVGACLRQQRHFVLLLVGDMCRAGSE